MKDKDMSFLHREAKKVKDWPECIQNLYDKGIVKVEYDTEDNPNFLLTELGKNVLNEINLKFN